jgi:molybdopterin biosynthesis enzyme
MTGVPLRLTAPDRALAALLALLPGPVAPGLVPVAEALGRVLARPLVAPGPVPAVPVARRDGWAVAAADTLGAGPYAPVPLPAAPARLGAGDPLPPGSDAVLPPFGLALDGPFAQLLEPVAAGEGVRLPGEEIAAGTLLRAAGERLSPRDLPALAACGIETVALRLPRLAWIAVGNEIAAAPARDTLWALFAALAAAEGGMPCRLAAVPDDPGAIAGALRAAAGHDLVLLAGGSGEGPGDRSAAGLAAAGRLVLHGLGARPGMTAGFGSVGETPVLLLPGRAEDALAAWVLLARPALRHLAGAAAPTPRRARLARKLASAVGLLDLVPVRLAAPGLAEPLAIGALPLGALAAADALLLVPPGVEGYEAGNEVELHPL